MIEAEGLTKQFPPSNIAARMGRWSAQHRKMAIFGWLGFVVLSLAIGSLIGTNRATDLEQFTGESQAAEKALDEAGLRPNSEVVLLKSDTLTLEDPEFKSAVRRCHRPALKGLLCRGLEGRPLTARRRSPRTAMPPSLTSTSPAIPLRPRLGSNPYLPRRPPRRPTTRS